MTPLALMIHASQAGVRDLTEADLRFLANLEERSLAELRGSHGNFAIRLTDLRNMQRAGYDTSAEIDRLVNEFVEGRP